jgi:uncharacterized protein YbjT (DUF2867 family)
MTRVVAVGASGMVGGHALRYALQNPHVKHVLSIGRKKPLHLAPELTEVQHSDFSDCSAPTSSGLPTSIRLSRAGNPR